MVRLIIFCGCFISILTATVLLAVGCFTRKWWLSKEASFHGGIWKHCYKRKCVGYDEVFTVKNTTDRPIVKETSNDLQAAITNLQALTLVSFILSTLAVFGTATLIYFVRRSSSVYISWWYRLLNLMLCAVGGFLGIVAVYLSTEPPQIVDPSMRFGYSWFFVLVASSVMVITSVCLLVTFYCRAFCKQPSSTESVDDIDLSTHQNTPHANHPYMQYYADESEPRSFDNDIIDASYSMSHLDAFSSQPYAELAFEIPTNNNHLTSSYTNLTHEHGSDYEEINK